MKRIIILGLLLLFSFYSFSQSLTNAKHELYLINYEENTLNIEKNMNMTSKDQTYYTGTIEAISTDTGQSVKYNFFFSTWDTKFKEFIIKDKNHQIIEPQLSYPDNNNAQFVAQDKKTTALLKDTSTVEYAILSSMFIWLDNQSVE